MNKVDRIENNINKMTKVENHNRENHMNIEDHREQDGQGRI
jgi:hypothetical protein